MCPVSIIIVNYNAGDRLVSCVTSIFNTLDPSEIIVVDNDSRDGSIEKLDTVFGDEKQFYIIRNKANLGFGRACNIGARQASGAYLLYLNPDCLINDHTIPALVTALEQFPDAGMAGGRLMNPDGTEQPGGRRELPSPWRAFVRLSGLYRLKKRFPSILPDFLMHQEKVPNNAIEVEAVSGACMMVPRRTIDEVGGFDEAYFLHVEDLDWCVRIRQKGRKILFVPEAEVVHSKGACSNDRPVFVEWHKHLGLTRFYWRFFGHQYFGVFMPIITIGVWSHFLLVIICQMFKNGSQID